jgi:hypothetical protein
MFLLVNRWQVLGPSMLGLRHSHDPNLILFRREKSQVASGTRNTTAPALQLMTTRPVAAGDQMTCSFTGYNQLLPVMQNRGLGQNGELSASPAVQQALATLVQAGQQLEQLHTVPVGLANNALEDCQKSVRLSYRTLAQLDEQNWMTQMGRVLLLQHALDRCVCTGNITRAHSPNEETPCNLPIWPPDEVQYGSEEHVGNLWRWLTGGGAGLSPLNAAVYLLTIGATGACECVHCPIVGKYVL